MAEDRNLKANSLTVESFNHELSVRVDDIRRLVDDDVNVDRFVLALKTAVAGNPNLLRCKPHELFREIGKAAEDGLYPDGREGVLNCYGTSVTWIPMIRGIRRRAADLGYKIDANVVHENDAFDWEEGDTPHISHKPAKLGTDRGAMIGAYAIFRQISTQEIVHREVMDAGQISKVKAMSKAQNGPLWKAFEDQAWCKSVIRRGIKSVPDVDIKLLNIIERDDSLYDFGKHDVAQPEQKEQKRRVPPPPPPPPPPAKQVLTADEKIEKSIAILEKSVETGSFGTAVKVVRGAYAVMEANEFTAEQHVRIADEFASAAGKLIAAQANEDTRNEWITLCQDLRDESIITAGQYLEIQNAYAGE